MPANLPPTAEPAQPRRNIELKARCRDLNRAAEAARSIGAERVGLLEQIDTYFHVQNGRLKLRQTENRPAELIAYARPDSPDLRDSNYYLTPIADAAVARTALASTLGIRVEVRKTRELWMYHNVRIHLDAVAGLGTFLEFEAVITTDADASASPARLEKLIAALDVRADDHISVSYSDLLLAKTTTP